MSAASITNAVPTAGTAIGVLDTIQFDVLHGTAAAAVVTAVFAGTNVADVVHDGTSFQGYYANPRSTRTAISGGWTFVVYRAGGWTAAPTVNTYGVQT